MTATAQKADTIILSEQDADIFKTIELPDNPHLSLEGEDGTAVRLSESAHETLIEALRSLIANGEVVIARMPEELSSSTAADVIGVSRPTLMKWANQGRIPSFKVGSHTRFKRDDVLSFKRDRAKAKSDAFERLRQFEFETFGPLAD